MKRIGFDIDKELEYAWAAGLFDGEGSVVYGKEKDRPNPRIHLTISMTCKDSIEKFYEIVGTGNIRKLKYYENHPKYKEQWRWSTESSPKVADVLNKIGKYLVTKKGVVNMALEFWHNNFNPDNRKTWKKVLGDTKEVMPHAV